MSESILPELEKFGPNHCEKVSYEWADNYTRKLASSHYENFTVLSWFLPRKFRPDFAHVYAFCRWSDDLGDETGDREKSKKLLNWWRSELDLCYEGKPRHPVFIALANTIEKYDIPRKPFDDLIDAFVQDQHVVRYNSWNQVVDYCTRSADPVGRLVLYLCGHRDQERQKLSDKTCTGLQLVNFWQDVRRDILERDRVYIPQEIAQKHNLDIEQMVEIVKEHEAGAAGSKEKIESILPAYRATLKELVEKTAPMFTDGRALLKTIEPTMSANIRLFSDGGEAVLRLIEKENYDTILSRPHLPKNKKISLMLRALISRFCRVRTTHQ